MSDGQLRSLPKTKTKSTTTKPPPPSTQGSSGTSSHCGTGRRAGGRTLGSDEAYEGCEAGGDVLCGRDVAAAAGGGCGIGSGVSRQPEPRRSSGGRGGRTKSSMVVSLVLFVELGGCAAGESMFSGKDSFTYGAGFLGVCLLRLG